MKARVVLAATVMVSMSMSLIACGNDDPKTLTMLVYDSFPTEGTPLNEALAEFTGDTGIKVQLLTAGDTGTMVTKATLTAGNPEGDVMWDEVVILANRTVGAMSLTTSKTIYRGGYQPLMAGVFVAPFPYAYRYGWDAEQASAWCLDELDLLLATARIIDEGENEQGLIQVGTTVTIQEDGNEPETYMIVGPAEANPLLGRISNESPIGKAVLGHHKGDIVQVSAPVGSYNVKIIDIE